MREKKQELAVKEEINDLGLKIKWNNIDMHTRLNSNVIDCAEITLAAKCDPEILKAG
jgi:hypothetical protein